jgi:hypothetical protein
MVFVGGGGSGVLVAITSVGVGGSSGISTGSVDEASEAHAPSRNPSKIIPDKIFLSMKSKSFNPIHHPLRHKLAWSGHPDKTRQ